MVASKSGDSRTETNTRSRRIDCQTIIQPNTPIFEQTIMSGLVFDHQQQLPPIVTKVYFLVKQRSFRTSTTTKPASLGIAGCVSDSAAQWLIIFFLRHSKLVTVHPVHLRGVFAWRKYTLAVRSLVICCSPLVNLTSERRSCSFTT